MKLGIYARAGQIANTPSSQEITAYYDASDYNQICGGRAGTVTVYAATDTTIASAYSNSNYIYSDSSLTTIASSGWYADSFPGSNYQWTSGEEASWTSTAVCEG